MIIQKKTKKNQNIETIVYIIINYNIIIVFYNRENKYENKLQVLSNKILSSLHLSFVLKIILVSIVFFLTLKVDHLWSIFIVDGKNAFM